MGRPAMPAVEADKGSSSTPRNGSKSPLGGGGAEVSWLGVIARRRLPGGIDPSVALAAGSPLTVAGAAPALHRTSLSRRSRTLARRAAYRQHARSAGTVIAVDG